MANRVPTHAETGFTLHRPPLPLIYKPHSCGDTPPSCNAELCMQKRQLRRAKHNVSAGIELCNRCECALCLICAKPRNRWTSPLGQMLESVTTNTDPPFTFAYNPNDADMQRMREQLVLEPVLVLEPATVLADPATAGGCRRSGTATPAATHARGASGTTAAARSRRTWA